MNKNDHNEHIYKPLRKLANLFKIEEEKCMGEMADAIVKFHSRFSREASPRLKPKEKKDPPLIKRVHVPNLSESINDKPVQRVKLHKFSHFEDIKHRYLLKSNLTN
jgi:hypothetical protein